MIIILKSRLIHLYRMLTIQNRCIITVTFFLHWTHDIAIIFIYIIKKKTIQMKLKNSVCNINFI